MRLATILLLAGALAGHAQEVLFEDTFDRADSRNIDATLAGITDHTGSALPADGVYSQSWLDPDNGPPAYGVQDGVSTNGGGAQVLSNQLQLAVGAGTSNACINHNFTNAGILSAGGFSVSLDVVGYAQAGFGQGGGFAVGMTQAGVAAAGDAFNGASRMTGAFEQTIGNPVPAQVVSDFWVVLRGNSTLVWGGRTGNVMGVTGLPARTGTIRVNFALSDFTAGSTVGYEVLLNGVPQGSGSFSWSEGNANHIGLDARDNAGVAFDNFRVGTWTPAPPPAAVQLAVSPAVVAPDNPAQAVTLTWAGANLPAGAGYQITADRAVQFPGGGEAGAATDAGGSVAAVVDGTLGPTTFTLTVRDAGAEVIATATAVVRLAGRPNVMVIVVDDMGWSDLGCYGSEIPTPNLDRLAAGGTRFRQFYNAARCSPTRISIMTGLYPQQGAGDPSAALPDLRNDNNATFAEVLGAGGYRTYMAGKWHLGNGALLPENRGFEHAFRFANGGAHSADQWNQAAYTLASQGGEVAFRDYAGGGQTFYQTDAIGDYATDFIDHHVGKGDDAPFAMYLAFGAPHFPIQAPAALADESVAAYAAGWDAVRQARYASQLALGVIDPRYPFPGLGGTGPHQAEPIVAIPPWDTLGADRQADLARRMALYAAMIRKIDANIGKVVARLEQAGRLDNTLICFLSDNGGNHESGVFGSGTGGPLTGAALAGMGQPGQGDNIHYGGGWAHVSNTPLKLFKHFTHEGGIRAPCIIHWPAGCAARNAWCETPAHLIDIVATLEDAAGAAHPASFGGHAVLPLEGESLLPLLDGQSIAERPLFVEHESNRAIRKGKWKLVTEAFTAFDDEFAAHQKLLYDMDADPGETTDVAAANPAVVVGLVDEWNAWATRVGLPSGRLMARPPDNRTPATTPADLFLDTFNRADATDVDAAADGMSGSRVPPLGAGAAWFEGFEGSGTADSIQVVDGILQMATGSGMSESGLNHNFIGQEILDAGGFSVSLRILNITTDPGDAANRYAGFAVGLGAAEAAAGNDFSSADPPPFRGSTTNPGCADAFLELDLNGNVKLWTGGVLSATVPVGKTSGTLTASFAVTSFAAGAEVVVSVFLDGQCLDLDPAAPGITRSFAWGATDSNFLGLSARATSFAQVDNFAVRRLPLCHALGVEHALAAGLDGPATAAAADPDGDRLDNFAEWAFGTNPARADSEVAATRLVLVEPTAGSFRFAHRRLAGHAATGIGYLYQSSTDLAGWQPASVTELAADPLPASPGYEAVTLALPSDLVAGAGRIFLRIAAGS